MEEELWLPTIAPECHHHPYSSSSAINTTFTYNRTQIQASFSLAIPDVHLLFTFDLFLQL